MMEMAMEDGDGDGDGDGVGPAVYKVKFGGIIVIDISLT